MWFNFLELTFALTWQRCDGKVFLRIFAKYIYTQTEKMMRKKKWWEFVFFVFRWHGKFDFWWNNNIFFTNLCRPHMTEMWSKCFALNFGKLEEHTDGQNYEIKPGWEILFLQKIWFFSTDQFLSLTFDLTWQRCDWNVLLRIFWKLNYTWKDKRSDKMTKKKWEIDFFHSIPYEKFDFW